MAATNSAISAAGVAEEAAFTEPTSIITSAREGSSTWAARGWQMTVGEDKDREDTSHHTIKQIRI
jgi:hypothetical protein